MGCVNRQSKFPIGLPGPCLSGFATLYAINVQSGSMVVPLATSQATTTIGVAGGGQVKFALPTGKYVIEFIGNFSCSSHKAIHNYYHNFKRLVSGIMTLIPGGYKEVIHDQDGITSRLPLHIKTQIFDITLPSETIYFTHGVKNNGTAITDPRLFDVMILIYKL